MSIFSNRFIEFFSKKLSSGGSGSGEINVGQNVGTEGTGIYKGKSGIYLQFKKLVSKSLNLLISDNPTNNTVELNLDLSGIEVNHFAGFLTNSGITDNGDGSITVGNEDVALYDNSDFDGSIKTYTLTGGIFNCIVNEICFLVGDYNSGTPIFRIIPESNVEEINQSNIVPFATLCRNGDDIIHSLGWDTLAKGMTNRHNIRFVKTRRFEREDGLVLSANASRNLLITTGRFWYGSVRKTFIPYSSDTAFFRFYYHSSGDWVYDDTRTTLINEYYDNGTDRLSLNSQKYVVNWIYACASETDKAFVIIGNEYVNLTEALNEKRPVTPDFISYMAFPIGRIIYQQGSNTAKAVLSEFDNVTGNQTVTSHSDLSNLSTSGHPATIISTVTTNFDGILSATENTTQKALDKLDDHTHSLNDINDVSITSISSGDILKYTGSVFENMDDEKILGISLGSKSSDLALETSFPLVIPFNASIKKVIAQVNSTPSGSDLIIDININGTSIWDTNQVNRLTILDGVLSGSQDTFDTVNISENDVITIDIDQVGSTSAGQDLSVFIILNRL